MAHQTPQYPTYLEPEELYDSIMIGFPFSSFFASFRWRKDDPDKDRNKGNVVLDSITFSPTTDGPRTKKSTEEMQCIMDHLYTILDNLSLLDRFIREAEREKERLPMTEVERKESETAGEEIRDAVKICAKTIQYWDEEWIPEGSRAKSEFEKMETAATLISDLLEGVSDVSSQTWDELSKLCLSRARGWLQCGGFDRAALYDEYDGVRDESNMEESISWLVFRCNLCPDAFNRLGRLMEHLREDHSDPTGEQNATWRIHTGSIKRMRRRSWRAAKRMGKSVRQRVLEGITAQELATSRVAQNTRGEGSSKVVDKSTRPALLLEIEEGWLDLSSAPGASL